jgi:hypothetical protein
MVGIDRGALRGAERRSPSMQARTPPPGWRRPTCRGESNFPMARYSVILGLCCIGWESQVCILPCCLMTVLIGACVCSLLPCSNYGFDPLSLGKVGCKRPPEDRMAALTACAWQSSTQNMAGLPQGDLTHACHVCDLAGPGLAEALR